LAINIGKRGVIMRREIRRLYLSLGEEVVHLRHPEWGIGKVIEERNSTVPGGLSMVRIEFGNVGLKAFNNNIDSLYCCYHAGVRRHP
jgi:hypothetical protein